MNIQQLATQLVTFHPRRPPEETKEVGHDFSLLLMKHVFKCVLKNHVLAPRLPTHLGRVELICLDCLELRPHFDSIVGNQVVKVMDPHQLVVALLETLQLLLLGPTRLFQDVG